MADISQPAAEEEMDRSLSQQHDMSLHAVCRVGVLRSGFNRRKYTSLKTCFKDLKRPKKLRCVFLPHTLMVVAAGSGFSRRYDQS